jgi:type II secretory pathway component GspD/PulD (secretin)
VAVLLGVSGCETPSSPSSRERQREVTDELYTELIEQSSLTPIEGFDQEEFSDLEREYADPGRDEGADGAAARAADGPDSGDTDPAPWDYDELEAIPINPYLEFGANIIQYDDGRIMKPYPLPTGQGEKIDRLLRRYGRFKIFNVPAAEGTAVVSAAEIEQPAGTVALDMQPGWLTESWADPRGPQLVPGTAVPLGDVLFVTAAPDLMREVEHFIDLFAAEVRQIEIEAKIVEVTTTDTFQLGITPINDSTPILGLPNSSGLFKSFNYSFPIAEAASLLTIGAVQDGAQFNAVLQAFAGLENVSIISRPKVAVREGGRAEIVNTTRLPYLRLSGIDNEGSFSATVEYLDVGVQMYVIPRVVGTNTVVLNIDIEASQQTGNQVTFATTSGTSAQEITTPILAIRKARTIVRLEPGQAVVIGGLISERSVERESKVPLLGDIPLLGMLFRSTSRATEQTNVLFFIRPRILQGSDLNRPFE